jgi:hypothetical protein
MDFYRRHIQGKLGNVPNLTELTDDFWKMTETGAEGKKPGKTRRPTESRPDPESPFRTSVINALSGMGIAKRKAGELVDAIKGDTEAEIIKNSLRLHGQALVKPTEPQESSHAADTDQPETILQETSPEPIADNGTPDPLLEKWMEQLRQVDDSGFDEKEKFWKEQHTKYGLPHYSDEDRTHVLECMADARTFIERYEKDLLPAPGDEPKISLEDLSPTSQQKLDKVIRQHKAKLAEEFHDAVNSRVQEFLENTIGPQLEAEQEKARRIMESRKGVMDLKSFKKIRDCLHSDRVIDPVLKPKYDEAFTLFMAIEQRLLDEKNSPTPFVDIPRTPAEWAERKRQVSERKRTREKNRRS